MKEGDASCTLQTEATYVKSNLFEPTNGRQTCNLVHPTKGHRWQSTILGVLELALTTTSSLCVV